MPSTRLLNPELRSIIPTAVNTRTTLLAQECYAKALAIFKEIEDVDQTLKSLILKSFDNKYCTILKNNYTSFTM